MELFKVVSVDDAKEQLNNQFRNIELSNEKVHILDAIERILGEDIISKENVPQFNRSTVDGYSVIAKETYGASESLPAFLDIVGISEMGKSNTFTIEKSQCVYVPTGGMIPDGADSVVMIEYTEIFDEISIAINGAVASGDNTMAIGNDVKIGQTVLKKGKRLKSQDIGVLASLGITEVNVLRKPKISIISTGDEIIDIDSKLEIGLIRDINAYTISTMLTGLGCQVTERKIVRDDFEQLKTALSSAMEISDAVLLSGGSSVGTKDYTPEVINALGDPGVFVHGVAMKPGKPTILSNVNGKAVFGLPGQPVSAIIAFKVFVEHYLNIITKQNNIDKPYILGESVSNIHSAQGREHYQMVNLDLVDGIYKVSQVHGKSGMITLMSQAKGYICIPKNKEGVEKGERVRVFLF